MLFIYSVRSIEQSCFRPKNGGGDVVIVVSVLDGDRNCGMSQGLDDVVGFRLAFLT